MNPDRPDRTRNPRSSLAFAGVVAFAAVALFACAGTGGGSASSETALSWEEKIVIGDAAAPILEEKFGGVVDDLVGAAIITDFGRRIAPDDESTPTFRFALLKSPIPGTFSLPGGRIYLTCGLVTRLEQDRELAAILAHQLGHLALGHPVAAMRRLMGEEEFLASLESPDGALWADAAAELRYEPAEEVEADSLAVGYLTAAGYDPVGIIEVLENPLLESGLAAHPVDSARLRSIRAAMDEHISEESWDEGGASPDFRSLQKAVEAVMAEEDRR
jgi:predicted Zn-dependent protease